MHGASNQQRYTITYFYKGQERTAEVTEVFQATGPRSYWFKFKNQPPRNLVHDGDSWEMGGRPLLPDELVQALIDGIKAKKTSR